MEAYGRCQLDLQSKINKAKINFKKSPKDRITQSYVETRLETLEENWTLFRQTHRNIMSEIDWKEIESSSYQKDETYEQTEEVYTEYKSDLKRILSELQDDFVSAKSSTLDPVSHNAQTGDAYCGVRLHEISIPMFSGKYTEWTSFRDLFVSLVHDNKRFDEVTKLRHLKSHVVGEAEQLLRHLPITNGNYQICWDKLENRYNNKKYLANCILKRLFNQKSMSVESPNAIKDLLDTTSECLSALNNLGIDTSTWDVIIIYMISSKLDSESRKQWELKACDSSELPKFKEFQNFLENRFRALEFIDPKLMRNNNIQHSTPVKSLHITTPSICPCCNEHHKLSNCKKFSAQNVDSRRNLVQTSRLCFNCLCPNHAAFSCRQPSRCNVCKRKHHTLLHPENALPSADTSKNSVEGNVVAHASTSKALDEINDRKVVGCLSNTSSQVLLATALVEAVSPTGNTVVLRCLLDQGSQACLITESAVQLLGLKKRPNKSFISGLGSDGSANIASQSLVSVSLHSLHDPELKVEVRAHVLNKLTTFLPERKVVIKMWSELANLKLADPEFDTPNKVDMLLGADVYAQVLCEGLIQGPPGSPIAQKTKLGWILSGRVSVSEDTARETCHNVVVSLHAAVNENELLKRFWEMEAETSGTTGKLLTPEEQRCEDIFSKTTKRDESGRYIVKLPFRDEDPKCQYGNSRDIAARRFHWLEKRLAENPQLKQQYAAVINEYLELGHAEIVPSSQQDEKHAVYLPHHAVVREERTTTKVRVVFDASCRGTNGVSLNNDMLIGPRLQLDLRHIIMRWRVHPISIVADIVKMYRQIKVTNADADFQRLFWRDNLEGKLQHIRMLRVTFGTASAPYLAVRALNQVAYDEGHDFPRASEKVLKDFYVDDLMTGCQSVPEGIQLCRDINELLERGGFELQKWSSNSDELLKEISGDKLNELGDLQIKEDSVMKILGITWNRKDDVFEYSVNLPSLNTPITKRKVISDISRLFDPLGADCASRGIKSSDCLDLGLWKQGPIWLQDTQIKYSPQKIGETKLEEKTTKVCLLATNEAEVDDEIVKRFSSLRRLVRVLSYCRRFLLIKKQSDQMKPWLTSSELQETLKNCIRNCQQQHFSKEIKDIQATGMVNKKSVLTSLSPFISPDGILRVGGRLEKTLHGGASLMVTYLQSKYRILGVKNLAKFFVRKCIVCIRYAAQFKNPVMGQLPAARVTANRPFSQCGVDYAGPINVRVSKGRGNKSYKGYICLYVCMATRAIHLEVVSDMTAEGFLASFRRFVARRGHCYDMYSDNGTNFKGAARELKALFADENARVTRDIAEALACNGTTWHFIPPHSPNFGGLWEAGVKSTKHHLKRVIGDSTLTFEEMTTLLCQLEACLNSRPMSYISNDPLDPSPLTPGHFLVGEALVSVADFSYEGSNINHLKRWQLTQRMVQDFWRRWSQEYLTQFLQRHKWTSANPEPNVGDIVLVKEDNLPPAKWLYGIVVEKHPGLDKVTRVVSLRCKDNVIKRPVAKLCFLPVTV